MSKKTVEKNPPKRRKRIMVFGTFDSLHPGHISFFKQARNLHQFPFLIVSIARDRNVFKIKGKYPEKNEKIRISLIRECALADKVVLSGVKNHIPHIIKERPDIIALGYDQKAYIKNLKNDLENKGVSVKIVRLKPFKEKIYKNHLLKKRT